MYLIPSPQKLAYTSKEFTLKYDTQIIINSRLGFMEYNYARILKDNINKHLCFVPDITKADDQTDNGIYLNLSPSLKEQEYTLSVQETKITLTGGSSTGLLYAVQTLSQIISQCLAVIPCLEISDYPGLINRGYYYDVTRGRIPTLETLKALADKLSYYKLNQLQLYVEHSFLFKDFSEVWRDDTPLTAEEILEFDRYCNSLNIELVPSIASFGHLHKVLCTKTYDELCELEGSNSDPFSYMGRMEHHTVDITNDKSFLMIETMLTEFIPLFSSKHFNICADETFDLGKGRSKELAAKIGTEQMYVDFVAKVCEVVKHHGKRPMFWGDIIVANPSAIQQLPQDIICLNWDYCTTPSEVNIKKLKDAGAVQYLCPGVHGWRRLVNHLRNAYDNISGMSKYAHSYNVLGLLNTDWGDYGHINQPEFSIPGMIYGAAFSWNSDIPDFEEINRQISMVEYLDRSGNLVSIFDQMCSQDYYLWLHTVQFKELTQRNAPHEEMTKLFLEVKPETLPQANQLIAKASEELYHILPQLDRQKRAVVKAYLIAAKGMELFNSIGLVIANQFQEFPALKSDSPKDLAVALEYWFKDYKELWRSGSKEGELYRLQEVILWYADYLREMA
jgi:hypothetical protein